MDEEILLGLKDCGSEESPKALASVLWLCVLEKAGGSGPQEKNLPYKIPVYQVD